MKITRTTKYERVSLNFSTEEILIRSEIKSLLENIPLEELKKAFKVEISDLNIESESSESDKIQIKVSLETEDLYDEEFFDGMIIDRKLKDQPCGERCDNLQTACPECYQEYLEYKKT